MVEIPIQLLCDQSEERTDGSRPTELGKGTKSSDCVAETSPTCTYCVYVRMCMREKFVQMAKI